MNLARVVDAATMAAFLYSTTAFAAKPAPPPEPRDEAVWLHATCVGQDIHGDPQPSIKSTLSPCVAPDGANKVETGYFTLNQKQVSCRFGVDQCPPDLKRSDALMRVVEEFSCRKGKRHGLYKASVHHRFLSQSIYGSRVEANYVDGRLQGESRHYAQSGICYTHRYKSGLLDGKSVKVVRGSPGKVLSEAHHKAGRRHGKTTKYRDAGTVAEVANYANGLLHGEVVHYAADGTVNHKSVYQHGDEVERMTVTNGKPQTMNRAALEAERRREVVAAQKRAAAPPPSRPWLRINDVFVIPGLNAGYRNDDLNDEQAEERGRERVDGPVVGPQLMLGLGDCMDTGCAAYFLNVGGGRSLTHDGQVYHGEFGLGLMAMYISGYLGAGVRVDGERTAIQSTFMAGITLLHLYVRGMAYVDGGSGLGLETGLALTLPLPFGF